MNILLPRETMVHWFDEGNINELESLKEGSAKKEAFSELTVQCKDRNNTKSIECCKISLKSDDLAKDPPTRLNVQASIAKKW